MPEESDHCQPERTSTTIEAGTLYVMRERDHRSGERSDYYKIGIVRGKNRVTAREWQHATGNPRAIETLLEVSSPAAQRLETRLHNHFAARRVSSGEWFHFLGSESELLLATVREFAQQIETYARLVTQPRFTIDWDSALRPADQTSEDLASTHLANEARLKASKSTINTISLILKTRAEHDSLLQPMLKTSIARGTNNFSVQELAKRCNHLYFAFRTKATESASFNIVFKSASLAERMDAAKTQATIEQERLEDMDSFTLHDLYLKLWGQRDQLVFEIEQTEKMLQTRTGTAPGIDGITSWTRKKSVAFDTAAFQEAHPDIYEQCRVARGPKTIINIAEWASYARP